MRVKKLLDFCNIKWDDLNASQLAKCKSLLNAKFINAWKNKRISLQNSSKLELYSSLKINFEREEYLRLPNYKLRNAIAKIRVSAHSFPIETGRYSNIPRADRICQLCMCGR